MKKWQIEKSETLEISKISKILFRVFLFSSFPFCSTAKIENSDLKISEKNFRDFRVFDLAVKLVNIFFWKLHVFKINMIFFSTVSFYLQKRFIKSKHEFFIKSIPKQTVEIFWNLILRNHRPYRLKQSRIKFITNWTWSRKIIAELPSWTRTDFMIYWS